MSKFPDWNKIHSPAFLLDKKKLISNLELLNSVQQKAGVNILLALKGFSMYSVFPLVKKYLHGATASSLNEAQLIYDEMKVKPHVYAPVFVPSEFDRINQIASHLVFNSTADWNRYKDRVNPTISVGLRVNPGYSEVKTDLYNPCALDSRLGVIPEELNDVLPEGIEGIHFHALCENNSYTLEKVLENLESRFKPILQQASWLNMGGGHLMTHKDYNISHLLQVLASFKSRYPHLKIYMEPGSAIAWETGYLVSTVLDVLKRDGKVIAILDVSFTCHMPDCLEMPYKPAIVNIEEKETGIPHILGGLSCLAGDQMGLYHFDEELKVGDKVVFNDMIHYTMVKTSSFNGINLPDIAILEEDGSVQTVKKFGHEVYKMRL